MGKLDKDAGSVAYYVRERPRTPYSAAAQESSQLGLVVAAISQPRRDAIGRGHQVWAERVDELLQ
jgi:hypothetical protein